MEGHRYLLSDTLVWSSSVVVPDTLQEHSLQMPLIHDHYAIYSGTFRTLKKSHALGTRSVPEPAIEFNALYEGLRALESRCYMPSVKQSNLAGHVASAR